MLLGLAYVGVGCLLWTLARLILGDVQEPLAGSVVVTRPLVVSFLMVAWDLSTDPIWSNLARGWVWHDGGPYNLFVISPPGLSVIAGVQWRVKDILEVCKLISIFVMGAFALIAWVGIIDDQRWSRHSPGSSSRTSAK
jgi:hypothetical protein